MPGTGRSGPILLGAFGDPGHAFPMIALGRALVARGHDVVLQTWRRWREHVEAEGMRFAAAPENHTLPAAPGEVGFYEAAELATHATSALVREVAPCVVVADILTLAPALAAELNEVPWATLIPHVYPVDAPGLPIYSVGARIARTRAGRALWEAAKRPVHAGVAQGRDELNGVRGRLGLPPLAHGHGGISRSLALVGTFPQLEYPRSWPPSAHVIGPLLWQPDGGAEPPLGEARTRDAGMTAARGPAQAAGQAAGRAAGRPLVLVAPSTSQDPGEGLLRAALAGLAHADVRVLATRNRKPPGAAIDGSRRESDAHRDVAHRAAALADRAHRNGRPSDGGAGGGAEGDVACGRARDARALPRAANATVVEWLSYDQAMTRADVVVCHAGHGTLVRALASGRPVVACPAAGDMNENAARVAWAGAGVRVPRRFVSGRVLRLAVEQVLADTRIGARARELQAWAQAHDPADMGAALVEELATRAGRDETHGRLRGWDSNPQPLG